MGLPNTPYPALIGQRLAAVRVFEPWQASLPPIEALGPALLFGGVAFVFERQALILTSPLRYRSKPVGTYYGLPDGRSVVTQLRNNKNRRQLIVITHNANIVVNGDAELVMPMEFVGGQIVNNTAGGLQERSVRKKVCEIMEGGEKAFEQRYKRILKDMERTA